MTRKDAFAALAKLIPGIWNKRGTIKEMNELLTAAGVPVDAPTEPEPERNATPTRISAEGIALIKRFEGCARRRPDGRLEAYPDPGTGGAPWTIGWGATGAGITKGTIWTQAEADAWFDKHIQRYAADVVRALGSAIERTSQRQFDALVSFHYNTGAIGRATLTAKHKAGDYAGAANEFHRWNRAGGRVLPGLTRRRAAEAAVYREGSA